MKEIKELQGAVEWRSPSNIAIVKYWGKHGNQIPNNPSLSFTLSSAYSQTKMAYEVDPSRKEFEMDFLFEGEKAAAFGERIKKFFNQNKADFPYLKHLKLSISSENSFPHSAGIASSASAMSALAMCITSLESRLFGGFEHRIQFRSRASHIARLASGSASRSIYGGLVCWGETESVAGSSDFFAVPVHEGIDPVFNSYQDSILIVDSGTKSVSSSAGHQLMNEHPYAQMRYFMARKHMEDLKPIMEGGDVEGFGEILEKEALGLHALMMNSSPSYLLMKPNTLALIERIKEIRVSENLPWYFTLDAGPNVHLLYPKSESKRAKKIIESEFKSLIESVLYDEVGEGPEQIKK